MMPNMNSPFKGLATVIVVLVVIGVIVGLAVAGSDLFNFITNGAKADAVRQELVVKQQKDAVDAENYKVLEEAKTKAQLDKIAADNAAYQKLQEQKLQAQAQLDALQVEISRLFDYGKIVITMILGVALSIGLLILTVQLGRRLVPAPVRVAQQTSFGDIWQNPNWQRSQRKLARQRELATRESILRQTQNTVVPAFYPEDELISWEEVRQQYAETRKSQKPNKPNYE